MDNKDKPAFPAEAKLQGMSKRELMAALALQGYISNSTVNQGHSPVSDYARYAVELADALLKELEK